LVLVAVALVATGSLVVALRQPGAGPVLPGPGGDAADKARTSPLEMRPRAERLIPVTAAEYQRIREQVQPPQKRKATSSYCLHLLRAHGLPEPLQHSELSSGEAVLRHLTDDNIGAAYFGQPALARTRSGARFLTGDNLTVGRDPSLEQHRDHTLAAFAELG